MVKISDNHLPCYQAIRENNLSKNILQNQIGETLNVYVFECGVIKAGSARKHLKLSHIVLCHSAGCHFELMKLCASCPCSIWVPESLFDTFQKDALCLHLRCPSYDCHGLIRCPDLCRASAHERERIQDLHSLVRKGISLHSDHDLNGSYKLFSLVSIPIKQFGIGSLGTLGQVV